MTPYVHPFTDVMGSWAKLKFSLVRVVDEVTIIFNSVEVEIVLVLVGGWVGGGEKNEINAILDSVVVEVEVCVELGNKNMI